MDRRDYRIEIRALFNSGLSISEIFQNLVSEHGDNAPSLSTIKRWYREFKMGNSSVEDAPRTGRPTSARSDQFIAAVRQAIQWYPKISTRAISDNIGISHESVRKILSEDLDMKKMNCRWIPKILTEAEKRQRVSTSRSILSAYADDWDSFVYRLVTGDETWVSYETPETRTSAAEWRPRGSRPPERPKIPENRKKIMVTVFWDCVGILLIKVMAKGTTINSERYCEVLEELYHAIREKRSGRLVRKVLLLHDNAKPHTAKKTVEKIKDLKFELVSHPPYSPDLAPSDYFLFKNLKNELRGQKFESENETMTALNQFFDSKSADWYKSGLDALKSRLERCIDLRGEYLD